MFVKACRSAAVMIPELERLSTEKTHTVKEQLAKENSLTEQIVKNSADNSLLLGERERLQQQVRPR